MKTYNLNSADESAVTELVMSLIKNETIDYVVFNEFDENITDEIKKLVSLKLRSIINKK